MADCMQLMLDIFNAGLGVSFCDWGCQILRSLDEKGGTVFQIVGAAQKSHSEWLEKQARTVGARKWRRDEIAANASGVKSAIFGNYRFKPRSECPDKPGYPRWLDMAPTVTGFFWRRRSLGCNVSSSSPWRWALQELPES